jgi:hypothetical protein
MDPPVVIDDLVYEAIDVMEYDLPPYGKCDDELLVLAQRDAVFYDILHTNPEYANPFIAQHNLYYYDIEIPQAEWTWSNTRESVRKMILRGLMNRGRLVIKLKDHIYNNIYTIPTYDEQKRLLDKCNYQLHYAWYWLDAFGYFDEKIFEMRRKVDDAWSIDPIISAHIEENTNAHIEENTNAHIEAENTSVHIEENTSAHIEENTNPQAQLSL